MGDTPSKVIEIVVGLILALLLATFAFLIFKNVREKGGEVASEVTGTMDSWLNSEVTQYEGAVIKGSEVVNVINTFYSENKQVYVTVKTNADTVGKTYCYTTALVKVASADETTLITNARDKTKNEYINPAGDFVGSVQTNTNGEIVGLIFTQK